MCARSGRCLYCGEERATNKNVFQDLTRFAIQAKGPDGKWARKPLAYRESNNVHLLITRPPEICVNLVFKHIHVAISIRYTSYRYQTTIILRGNALIPRTRTSNRVQSILGLGLREVYNVFRQGCCNLFTREVSCSRNDAFVDTKSD